MNIPNGLTLKVQNRQRTTRSLGNVILNGREIEHVHFKTTKELREAIRLQRKHEILIQGEIPADVLALLELPEEEREPEHEDAPSGLFYRDEFIRFSETIDGKIAGKADQKQVNEVAKEVKTATGKLADIVVNAKNFGLSESNTAEQNQQALQAANDFVYNRGGGRILIPNGLYETLNILQDSYVEFLGDGATLKSPDGTHNIIDSRTFTTFGSIVKGTKLLTVSSVENIKKGAAVAIRSAGGINRTQNTKLTEAISSDATELKVASTAHFPSSGMLKVGDELINYNGLTSTSFTNLNRAFYGTSAASHSVNAVVGQASYFYTYIESINGNELTLADAPPVSVVSTDVTIGSVGLVIDGITFDGNRRGRDNSDSLHGVKWDTVRLSKMPKASFKNCAMGGLILNQGCQDNQIGMIDVQDTGGPGAYRGAGLWLFRGNKRNVVQSINVSGDCYNGIYVDDRTQTGSEWDGHNEDNVFLNAIVRVPRGSTNTGIMVVGGHRNVFRGGHVEGARNGLIVDSNQVYTHDNGVPDSLGNTFDGIGLKDVFMGVTLRVPGNHASNIPMENVHVPVNPISIQPGNLLRNVGLGFGMDTETPIEYESAPSGVRGGVSLPGDVDGWLDSSYIYAPDNVGSDLDITALIHPDAWIDNGLGVVAAKWGTVPAERSWSLSAGLSRIVLTAYEEGATDVTVTLNQTITDLGFDLSKPMWIRATLVTKTVDNTSEIVLYMRQAKNLAGNIPDSHEWTEVGRATGTPFTTINKPNSSLSIGGAVGTSNYFKGKMYKVVVRDGIKGKPIINVDFRSANNIKNGEIIDKTGLRKWVLKNQVTFIES